MGARYRIFGSWRSGGSSKRSSIACGDCNMMAVMVTACWIAVVLLMFFPASAIARIEPGAYPSERTLSYMERTPRTSAGINYGSIQEVQQTGQEGDTIFGKKDSELGSSTLSSRRRRRIRRRRRGLVGSSPPTCVARCGACVPCKPVHVVITSPHPVISETDYYPEVWRCLCGNTYYMP